MDQPTATQPGAAELFDFNGTMLTVLMVDGSPWFVGSELAEVLEYRDASNALRSVRERNRGTHNVSTGSELRAKLCVNEPGLYELILKSRAPGAERFQDWVTGEVLPRIRRTGRYAPAMMTRTEALELALEASRRADAAEAAQLEAERLAKALEPSAASWDHLGSGGGNLSVADAAKILCSDPGINTGRDRLFASMASWGWVFRSRGSDKAWRAMQAAVDSGWLSEKPQSYQHPEHGTAVLASPQVRITPKGVAEAHRRLGGRRPLALEAVRERLEIEAGVQ